MTPKVPKMSLAAYAARARNYFLVSALACALAGGPGLVAEERGGSAAPRGVVPVALLQDGRRLDFVRELSSERDVRQHRKLFSKIIDFVVGAPEWRNLVRPYGVTTDSRGRLLITDPGANVVHIFDLKKNKYTAIEGGKKDSFRSPVGIAVDADDNIYVTDSQLGKVLVFAPGGKPIRLIGDIKGESFYKRPTGIACDRERGELYITDTLRNRIFVTDLHGTVLRQFGSRGTESGQFNYPTEVVVHGEDVLVVDAMNFRVQIFDRQGQFRAKFGGIGEEVGRLFRPKGVAVDSEGHIYLVDAALEAVQVFSREGQLLYTFGRSGFGIAGFELPAGIWIDSADQIYIADSYNHRLQVFHYGAAGGVGGAK